MELFDLGARFDSFQNDAVSNIQSDFSRNSYGRYLLVIPTGGGKTFTAVKAIYNLFKGSVLNVDKDFVLWVAHRTELLDQAKETFEKKINIESGDLKIKKHILFEMIRSAQQQLKANKSIKMVVIDEAHHVAANSYLPIFEYKELGILGLTATPSRHDGKPLEFERESYSIGFPDLVKIGVILKPEVVTIKGENYNFQTFNEDDLEQLNNKIRNQKIIDALIKNKKDYQKVIIYVGTLNHVTTLYQELIQSPLMNDYESISYITGEGNSRNQDRKEFVNQEKNYERSIIVNVHVLSEGYDDPSVNTVVMATPTRSKLYYMQAMGRAIRINNNDTLKKAFIIEVVDELPNIRYRIDNRWLYADISDALEPAVKDFEFSSKEEFIQLIQKIYKNYKVEDKYCYIPQFSPDERYTLLLFRKYCGPGNYSHLALSINNDNRPRISNMFNFLSERMEDFKKREVNSEVAFKMLGRDGSSLIRSKNDRRCIYGAMENAVPVSDGERPEFVSEGYPWITFIAFHYKQKKSDLDENILRFVEDMINKEELIELFRTRNFEKGAYLIRFPLPLKSYIGRIVNLNEFEVIKAIVDKLKEKKNEMGHKDHRSEVKDLIGDSILPIEISYSESLLLIAREEIEYYLPL